jgi:subtilase family serine protease
MKEQFKPIKPRRVFESRRVHIHSVSIALAIAVAASAQHCLSVESGNSCPSQNPSRKALPQSRADLRSQVAAGKNICAGLQGIQLHPAGVSYAAAQSAPSDLYGPHNILHAYSPTDICAAYGVDALHAEGWTGKGQTIVVIDSYGSPTALQDLKTFSAYYGLSAPDLTIIYPDGTPTYNATALGQSETSAADETSLDLQWAHVIAPDAKLVLIVGNPQEVVGVQGFPSLFKGIQYVITNYPGSPISQSFACAEQSFNGAAGVQLNRFEAIYQQAIAAGFTPLAAAGDWGTANPEKQGFGNQVWPSWPNVYPYQTVNWPASSPSVTAVGGTWLQYHWRWDPQATLAAVLALGDPHPFGHGDPVALAYMNWDVTDDRTEAVWREDWTFVPDGSGAATGGGLSSIFPTPLWQLGLPTTLTQAARALPDLSWNAAANGGVWVLDSVTGGWSPISGTSASTPQIAGLVALVNQMRASLGKGPIGHLAPKLYQLPASDFNDIVPQTFGSGANAVTVQDNLRYGYSVPSLPTTVGYDLTTGLGSPKAYSFAHDLATMFP